MRELSSRGTPFLKWGLPLICLGALAVAGLVLTLQVPELGVAPVVLLMASGGLPAAILCVWLMSDLADRVEADDDGLIVTKGGRTYRVVWDRLREVREQWWFNPNRVVVTLKRPVDGLDRVVFLPPLVFSRIREKATANFLRERIAAAQAAGAPRA